MFGTFCELVGPELKVRLRTAHAAEDPCLDSASLDAAHAEHTELLIVLQEALEAREDTNARDACTMIWRHLHASAQRHALALPFS
jgi:hypothetical protein